MGVDYRKQYRPEELEPFFPNEIVKMGVVVLCTLALVMVLVILPTLLEHIGLFGVFHEEQPADPRTTPAHIKPEWYFLATYQYLKLMPQKLAGIDGKALGVFSQGIGMLMLLLIPFWFPLDPARLDQRAWRRGFALFGVMMGCLVAVCLANAGVRLLLPDALKDLLHPMFVWPPAAVAAFVGAGIWGRRRGLENAFGWLKLYTVALLLIGFQFLVFIVVLAQGLAGALPAGVAYLIGGIPFLFAVLLILRFITLRVWGEDESFRWRALSVFVTESLLLFVGLTLWAMWPAHGLGGEHGWDSEAKNFVFSVALIAAALFVFYALIAAERRAINLTLGPPEKRRETQ